MKRIVACVVVLVAVLGAPPATAQLSPQPQPYWSPRDARPQESVGEVVMRFSDPNPGEWIYYTEDGDCSGYPSAEDPANPTPLSPAECGRPFARAGEDYVGMRGKWIFTEAGSRTIRIPIIDDDLDEADGEAFSIHVTKYDDLNGTTVYHNAYIRIWDDDPKAAADPSDDSSDGPPPPAVFTTVTRVEQRPTDQVTAGTAPPPAAAPASRPPVTTAVPPPPPDLEVALPSGELEPGPGFELVTERDPTSAPERDDPGGGSAAWWPLAFGATAVGSGGVVWLRRLRRWSPTRS